MSPGGVVHLFSNAPGHSTARYMAPAIRQAGHALRTYWGVLPEPEGLQPDDLLLFVDPVEDWPLRIEAAPCKTMAYFIDVHIELGMRLQMAKFFDYVFVAHKDYVAPFVEAGSERARWLPLGCAPHLHEGHSSERVLDVAFLGRKGQPGTRRRTLLEGILPKFATNDVDRYEPPSEMARIYSTAKIVLNASLDGDLNMRVFEAMASGALLVTDRIGNGLPELFEEGRHYVGYDSVEEGVAQISHYLAHRAEREAIARAGQQEAFAKHTYLHRWLAMREEMRTAHAAPARGMSNAQRGAAYAHVLASLRKPGRLIKVWRIYGFSRSLASGLAAGFLRWVNARIPLTPGAMRFKLGLARKARSR